MSPQEFDRSVIEGATREITRQRWSWLRDLPRTDRLEAVREIRENVAEEYRKMHVTQVIED
jgi:hypothetical protein